jgi:hypothetical protein
MRIEKRQIAGSKELILLVKEALEAEINGFEIIDQVVPESAEAEAGILAGDGNGKIFVVAAKEKSGDSLVMSFADHLVWLKQNRDRLARANPKYDWVEEPGLVLVAEAFSPGVLLLASMLCVEPKMCFTMKCLGIGAEKGLLMEPVALPEARVRRPAAAPAEARTGPEAVTEPEPEALLSRTVNDMIKIAEGLEVSASFGYRSKALDWVPVANLRSHRGTIWIESGPGKWTTKRIEDERALGNVLDAVRRSYDEILLAKGGSQESGEPELSDAERKSLHWE